MRTSQLAALLNARMLGEDVQVKGVARLRTAKPDEVGVLLKPSDTRWIRHTQAGCLLLSLKDAAELAHEVSSTLLVVDDPYQSLYSLLQAFLPTQRQKPKAGIHPQAYVDEEAHIDETAFIAPFAYIGKAHIGPGTHISPFAFIADEVHIGHSCIIGPGAVILEGCRLDNEVKIAAHGIIGAQAFAFTKQKQKNTRLPALGKVHLQKGVEIGAGSCVERGFLADTCLEEDVKIDDLVLVSHDVTVGAHTLISGQSAVGGHAAVGKNVAMGGQSAIAPYRTVAEGCQLSGRTALASRTQKDTIYSGAPALPHMDFLRQQAAQKRLYRWQKEIAHLKQRLQTLEDSQPN